MIHVKLTNNYDYSVNNGMRISKNAQIQEIPKHNTKYSKYFSIIKLLSSEVNNIKFGVRRYNFRGSLILYQKRHRLRRKKTLHNDSTLDFELNE